jgi:hypothetical protein
MRGRTIPRTWLASDQIDHTVRRRMASIEGAQRTSHQACR